MPEFAIEPLGPGHSEGRKVFHCGEPALDQWFSQQANQQQDKETSRTFVLRDTDNGDLAGFYSLSASMVLTSDLPPSIIKKYSRDYPVPAILLARLARHLNYLGQQVGDLLLVDALKRCVRSAADIGVAMIIVDAKSPRAVRFYQRHGFQSFPDSNRLWLSIKDARQNTAQL